MATIQPSSRPFVMQDEKEEQPAAPRGVRTERKDFDKHGYTEGCEGCIRMQSGGERRSHTHQYRERMLSAMGEDEEGREMNTWLETWSAE